MDPQVLAGEIAQHGIVAAAALARGSRRLERFRTLQAEPILGPVLAPLFDRDDVWIPDALRAVRFDLSLPITRVLERRNVP